MKKKKSKKKVQNNNNTPLQKEYQNWGSEIPNTGYKGEVKKKSKQ